ncbi:MAG TPA: hypothetical protein VJ767_00785 [Nitrososphaeraceae archaeon]|nr:hypothetical protein [Nitrososphaeraceae archaeon]
MTSLVFVLLFQTYSMGGAYGELGLMNSTIEADISNQLESASAGGIADLAVNASNFKFKDIIAEGKSTLLNVLDIKPNTPIKYNTIDCLLGTYWFLPEGASISEVNCDKIAVIGHGETVLVNNQTTYRNTPTVASSLLTAVSQGIEKPIRGCFLFQESPAMVSGYHISTLDCGKLNVLYK